MRKYLSVAWFVGSVVVFVVVAFESDGSDHIEPLIHLSAALVVAAVAGGMWWRERSLSGPLRRIAAANGWTFTRKSSAVAARWRGEPFTGTDHEATSVIRGQVSGRGFTAFNLNVTQSTGRNEVTTYFSVVALDLAVPLPVIEVRTTLGGVEQALGLSRIEFEHEGFNRKYRVTAADRKYASDVLSPRTIETVIAGRIVNLRIGGGRAVAWATGRLEVHEVLGWSRALAVTIDLIPDFVWKDHAAQRARPGLTWPSGPTSLGATSFPAQETQ